MDNFNSKLHAFAPGPDGHVGDGVIVAGEELVVLEPPVEHVELPLRLHGEPVDRVLPSERVMAWFVQFLNIVFKKIRDLR